MPRACFRVAADVLKEPDCRFPQILSQYLGTRFGSGPVERLPLAGTSTVNIEVGPASRFMIGVKKRNKFPQDDLWLLLVAPMRMRSVVALMRRRRTTDDATLIDVCHELHVFLTSTLGISEVRWYYRNLRTAVGTPEELPRGQG